MSILAALPQISLGTAAVLIFGVCLTYVLLRGVGKLMVGTAMLTVSALLGLITWQKAPELSIAVFNKTVGVITTGLPIVVFVGSFILFRLVLKWIANPFGGGTEKVPIKDRRGLSKFRILILLGFALIPTLVIMTFAVGFIHHKAGIHELERQVYDISPERTLIMQLNDSIEAVVPQFILEAIDPFTERSRIALAAWVTQNAANKEELEPGAEGSLPPAVDPETGEVIPRAIIVEDAELERLARERKFGTLLRHPVITKALKDPAVRQQVDDLDF